MRVCQLTRIELFIGMVAWAILLFSMVTSCAFAESPEEWQNLPAAISPIPIAPLFKEGPIDWKSFAPFVLHEQRSSWLFPAGLARGSACAADAAAPSVDSGSDRTESTTSPSSIEKERPIDWRTIGPDILHDQRAIWTFPTRLAHGEDWKPTLEFLFVLGTLISLDSRDTPYFRQTTAFSGFNHALTATNATVGTLLVPAALYAVGRLHKDSFATHTALLAGESAVDSEVVVEALKIAIGRRRPYAVPGGGNYSDTWFETYHPFPNTSGSFPSGHTILAFSVATVIAHRYRDHRWVPWVAYGAASLVGFSRLTQQAHFPSDVFAGAALGYFISRDVVMPGREPGF